MDKLRKDYFEVSMGNIEVLRTIPIMMLQEKWRIEIRKLVLDYVTEQALKNVRKRNG